MTHGEQAARVAFASADLKGERTIPLTKQALAAIIDSAIELFKMAQARSQASGEVKP